MFLKILRHRFSGQSVLVARTFKYLAFNCHSNSNLESISFQIKQHVSLTYAPGSSENVRAGVCAH